MNTAPLSSSPLVKILDRALPLSLLFGVVGLGSCIAITLFPSAFSLALVPCALLTTSVAIALVITHRVLRRIVPESSPQALGSSILQLHAHWRAAVDRFSVLLDNLAAAVIIRSPQGAITFCSPHTETLTGFTPEVCYQQSGDIILERTHPEDRERCSRALKMSAIGEPIQYRFRFTHHNGDEHWFETRTVPIHDNEGVLICSLSVMLDVTGLVRSQKQVEERNRDLQDFTHLLSHDLKAPLFTLKGMISVIEEDLTSPLTEEMREPFEHIKAATQRLETLITAVLEYAKLAALPLGSEQVQLQEAIRNALTDHAHLLRATGATLTIDPDLPSVVGDQFRITQIMSNLIGNSLKYRHPERSPQIFIKKHASSTERVLVLHMTDNGLGIPFDKQALLFRPFARFHSNRAEGVGIGLASVKRLMERLEGNITLVSSSPEGTTFALTFILRSFNEE